MMTKQSWCWIVATIAVVPFVSATGAESQAESPLANGVPQPPLRVLRTPAGNHFGLSCEKPATPLPTLFILANGIDAAGSDPTRFYTTTGRELAKDGWLYVVLDPVCEGYSRKEGEPSGLVGWAHRAKTGQDLFGPFVTSCIEILDHLIAEGYTDPGRIAVSGTSRGALCAFHFAAREPRIRVVTVVSPVTNPLALSEFTGVTEAQVKSITIDSLVDRLVGRTIWLSIGNDDQRVSTEDCVLFSRKLVTATRRLKPDLRVFPVELIVGPAPGHRAIDDAYLLEAQFLRKQFR